jgi:hypothetical protein
MTPGICDTRRRFPPSSTRVHGITEAARHIAIGVSCATAAAFLRLVAMLQGRDLVTFGGVVSAVRRHGRLLNSPKRRV